jgi:hypothetical protein
MGPRLFPPEHPLGSACLKIRRANIHINALKRSIRPFKPNTALSTKPIFGGKAELITLDVDPGIREQWGLIIGDIVSNLRAALDHTAWALAMTHCERTGTSLTGEQARNVRFPLVDESEYRRKQQREPRCEHILPAAIPTIKRFQPYNQREWPDLRLLAILNDLVNRDKHRVVSITRAAFRLPGNEVAIIPKKARLQFVGTSETDAFVAALKSDITFTLSVYRPGFSKDVDFADFPRMRDFIRNEVLPEFAEFVE